MTDIIIDATDPGVMPDLSADPILLLTDDTVDTTLIESTPVAVDETIALAYAEILLEPLKDAAPASDAPVVEPTVDATPVTAEPIPGADVVPTAGPSLIVIDGTDGDDTCLQFDVAGHDIRGLAGNDILTSISGGNRLDGGADGDVLISIGGDTLVGGSGYDRIELVVMDNWRGPVVLEDFCIDDTLSVIGENGQSLAGLTLDGNMIMLGDMAIAQLPSSDLFFSCLVA